MSASGYINLANAYLDYKSDEPALLHHINLFSLVGLPSYVDAPRMSMFGMKQHDYERLVEDGFRGVQSHFMLTPSLKKAAKADSQLSAAAILKDTSSLLEKAETWKRQGYLAATIMLGTGEESQAQANALAEEVLHISEQARFPVYLELHRATVTQDIAVVLQMIKAYPKLRFNADFSHYICAYRWLESFDVHTLKMIEPILARVAFVHLRFANSWHAQLAEVNENEKALYALLLQACFSFFKGTAGAGEVLIVAPELLPLYTSYTHIDSSSLGHNEIGDRYQQSLEFKTWAQELFDKAPHIFDFAYYAARLADIKVEAPESSAAPIRIENEVDFDNLAVKDYQQFVIGSAMSSPHEIKKLLDIYMGLQQKYPTISLKVQRNSITHDLNRTLLIQQQYPSLQLALDLAEWMIAQEVTVDRLLPFAKRVKLLSNVVSYANERANGEHFFTAHSYSLFCQNPLSVLSELFYRRVYKRLAFYFVGEANYQSPVVSKQQ